MTLALVEFHQNVLELFLQFIQVTLNSSSILNVCTSTQLGVTCKCADMNPCLCFQKWTFSSLWKTHSLTLKKEETQFYTPFLLTGNWQFTVGLTSLSQQFNN